ncbi:MAG: hypothetical protein F7B17_08605, partial [Desulfurococcales archaeon]|nr:hypothetical protein [Desulfurococcales archaeon]
VRAVRVAGALKNLPAKTLDFAAENPHAPFIMVFIVLLVLAAYFLAVGDEESADRMAEYAYYSLVAGVAVALAVEVFRGGRGSRSSKEEGSND